MNPRTVRASAAAIAVATLLLTAACTAEPGAAPASTSTSVPAAGPASELIGPERFAEAIDRPGVVTVNVHVPDEGSIAGTDLVIPFDQIVTSTALPADRATPLAVYCRSGNMSAQAVRDLEAMGYTDIVELDGGFAAWEASGRPLEPAA